MKEALKNIIDFNDVEAIYYTGKSAEAVYATQAFKKKFESEILPKSSELESILKGIGDANEAELIYSENRIYVRKVEENYLLIILGFTTPASMLQLNCDISIPELLKQNSKPRGLGRFFKR